MGRVVLGYDFNLSWGIKQYGEDKKKKRKATFSFCWKHVQFGLMNISENTNIQYSDMWNCLSIQQPAIINVKSNPNISFSPFPV